MTTKIADYLDKDAIASKLGFEPKTSPFETLASALGLFGVGVLVGAGVALLLAPKSGRDLREDIRNKVSGEGLSAVAGSTPSSAFGDDRRTI